MALSLLRLSESCRRSEEHTSELQSQFHLVCRLLLEKKKILLLSGIFHSNKTWDILTILRTHSHSTLPVLDRISRIRCRRSISKIPFFFFNDTAPTEIYPLSLPDALPIWSRPRRRRRRRAATATTPASPTRARAARSEEHTSELQSQSNLVCRLLLEK